MLHRPIWSPKWNRSAHVAAQEMNGIAHRICTGLNWSVGLVELPPALRAHAPLAASCICHDAVSRAINKNTAFQVQLRFPVLHHSQHRTDFARVVFIHRTDISVQMQGQPGCSLCNVIKHHIPDAVGPPIFINLGMVTSTFLNQGFRDNTCFTCIGMERR